MQHDVLPTPPASAGEWPAYVLTLLGVLLVISWGALGWLYRENRRDVRENAEALKDVAKAAQPSTDTLHRVTAAAAVLEERIDGLEKRVDQHDDWIDRTPAHGAKRSTR